MHSDSAISVSALIVNPIACSAMNVAITEIGSVSAVITVLRHECRKRNTTSTVTSAPSMMVRCVSSTERRTHSLRSRITVSLISAGSCFRSPATASRRPLPTSTVFAPRILTTSSVTARRPSRREIELSSFATSIAFMFGSIPPAPELRAAVCTSASPSMTRATWPSVIGVLPPAVRPPALLIPVPRRATMIRENAIGSLIRPSMRTSFSSLPRVIDPAGMSRFSLRSAVMICSTPTPSEVIAAGSSRIWICRRVPPESSIEPTPRTFSMRLRITCSDSVVSSRRPRASDVTARLKIGCSLSVSAFEMYGSLASLGKPIRIRAIRSRTSWITTLMSVFSSNSMITTLEPSRDRDVIWRTPPIGLSASSIGFVRSCSTASGDAPG